MDIYRQIWIKFHGPIPKDWEGRSYEIHHIDGNDTNNLIENLRCVSIREHYDIHWFQGDWGACFAISKRIQITPTEKTTLSFLTQQKRIKNGTHPFISGEIQR